MPNQFEIKGPSGSGGVRSNRSDDVASQVSLPQVHPSLAAFLELAPDPVVLTDRGGLIIRINKLAEEMFGYSPDELLGKPVESLVPGRSRASHALARQQFLDSPQVRPMGALEPLVALRKDGTELPVEISLSPFASADGTLVVSVVRDLTERLGAEAKFRGFLESAPDAVVVVDLDGRIAIVNTLTEQMFGYGREELVGLPVEALVPERFRQAHVHDRSGYSREPRTRPMGAGQELWGRRKDGSEFPVEISLSPIKTERGTMVTSIIRDITQRRATEDRIKASLREKEVLLKEIHHRVKNNLQITSSLLKLQSAYIQDPQAQEMFADSQNRIRSMALVHEKLYQSSDLSRVNFSEYVESLAALLFRSYGVDTNQIRLSIETDQVYLSIESAVPCGLILNELLSNCLKHAFPEKRAGEIRISVTEHAEDMSLELVVADNGIGLPKGINLDQTETLGLQLVRTLTHQLNGNLDYSGSGWTEFKVCFPINKNP